MTDNHGWTSRHNKPFHHCKTHKPLPPPSSSSFLRPKLSIVSYLKAVSHHHSNNKSNNVFKTWKQNSILRPCSNFFWLSIRKACQNGTILIAPLILISFLLASLSLSLSLFFHFSLNYTHSVSDCIALTYRYKKGLVSISSPFLSKYLLFYSVFYSLSIAFKIFTLSLRIRESRL